MHHENKIKIVLVKITCLFRPHSFLTATLVVAVATLLQCTAPSALAAGPFYWDCNDGAAGFGTAQGSFAGTTIPTATYGWSTNSTGSTTISGGSGVNPGTAGNVYFGTSTDGLGSGTITVGGTQNIGDITFGSASGAITLDGGTLNQGSAATITVNNSLDTINSAVKGSGNGLTIAGSGTLALNGLNIFSGKLTIGNNAASTLKVQFNTIGNVGAVTGSSLGQPTNAANGRIQIGANSKTSTLEFTGASAAGSTDRQVLVGSPSGVGGATILNNNADSAYSLTFANAAFNVAVTTAAARSLTLGGTNAGNNQIQGVIADNSGASVAVVKSDSGTWILSGANTYSGNTTVNAGTLQLGADGIIPDGTGKGNVSVAGTLDLNTHAETINGLSGAGTVDTLAGGTPTLTVGGNDQTSTFSGVIKNTAGTLALTKIGTGALTLSGMNTYSGNTIVSNGTLVIQVASLATNTTVSVAAGAQLQLNFAGGETNFVAAFYTNGVALPNGVYKAGNVGPFLAGTGSLQVGSVTPVIPSPAVLTNSISGSKLTLTWPSGQGWTLKSQTNNLSTGLDTNASAWGIVSGGIGGSNSITINPANPSGFYRLFWAP
jgi:autotransporter-associated beta strand protein